MLARFGILLLSTTALSVSLPQMVHAGLLGLDEAVEDVVDTVDETVEVAGEAVEDLGDVAEAAAEGDLGGAAEETTEAVADATEGVGEIAKEADVVAPVDVAVTLDQGLQAEVAAGGEPVVAVAVAPRGAAVGAGGSAGAPGSPRAAGAMPAQALMAPVFVPPAADQCPTILAHPGAYPAEQVAYCQRVTIGEPLTIEVAQAEQKCDGPAFVVVPLKNAPGPGARLETETVATTITVLSDAGNLARFDCSCSPGWCAPNLKGMNGPVLLTYGYEPSRQAGVDPVVTAGVAPMPVEPAPGPIAGEPPQMIAVAYPPPPPLVPSDPIAALIIEDAPAPVMPAPPAPVVIAPAMEAVPPPPLTPVPVTAPVVTAPVVSAPVVTAPAVSAPVEVAAAEAGPTMPGGLPIAIAALPPPAVIPAARPRVPVAAPVAAIVVPPEETLPPVPAAPSVAVAAVTPGDVPPLATPAIVAPIAPAAPPPPAPVAPAVVALAVPEPVVPEAPAPVVAAPIVTPPMANVPAPVVPVPPPRPAQMVQTAPATPTDPAGTANINRNGLWRPGGAYGAPSATVPPAFAL